MTPTDLPFVPAEDSKETGDLKNLLKAASIISFANYLGKYNEVTPENLDRYFRKKIRLYKEKIEDSLLDRSAKYRKEVIERMIKNVSLEFLSFIKTYDLEISSVVPQIGNTNHNIKTYPATDMANFVAEEKKWFKKGLRFFTLKYIVNGKGIAKEKKRVEEIAKREELLREAKVMKHISAADNKADTALKEAQKNKDKVEKAKMGQRLKDAKVMKLISATDKKADVAIEEAKKAKAMIENTKAGNRKNIKSVAELKKIMTKIDASEKEKDGAKKVKLEGELKGKVINNFTYWKYGYDNLRLLTYWLIEQGYIINASNFELAFSDSLSDTDKVNWFKSPKYALIYLAYKLGRRNSHQWIVDHFLFKGKKITISELQKLHSKYREIFVGSEPQNRAHPAIQNIYSFVRSIKS